MKHKPNPLLYAALMLPSMWLLMSNEAYASTGALNLNNFQVGAGARVSVPITINITEGDLSGFLVDLTYDESVVDVLSDADITINPAFLGMANASAGAGLTKISGVIAASGLTGNVTLANVTFTGIGAPGTTANVTVAPEPGNFIDSATAVFIPEPSPVTAQASVFDFTPDTISFVNQMNVPLSTVIDSAPVTVTGIDPNTPVSISGGEYSIDGGAFTNTPGTINSGQSVVVRVTSAADYSTPVSAYFRVGTGGDNFVVTTLPFGDQTPDAFSFVNQVNVPLSTFVESAPVTITGIDVPTPVTITGGEYSINGGAYTAAPGTINSGETISVRVMSSDQYLTPTTTVLKVGLGGDDFRVTTLALDTTPDQFTFTDQVDVAQNTQIVSAPIVVSGINQPSPITIANGEYAINGGAFTAADGTVNNGDSITVRVTSAAAALTPATATVTIGGVSDDFTATTLAADTTPDAFTFNAITNAPLSTAETSDPITVSGIEAPAAISVVDGEYSINAAPFIADPGLISNGEQVVVRHTSSPSYSTTTSATLNIGGVTGNFDVTTIADPNDTTPDPFTFIDQVGAPTSTIVESQPVTISGLGGPAAISIVNGEYSIDGGAYTAIPGTISNGQQVKVRQTSAATFLTNTDTVLTIGGVSDTFTSNTIADPAADTTPDQFTFTDQPDVALNTQVSSNTITITGIDAPTPLSIVGGEYSINGGAFSTLPVNVNNNDTVVVRVTSSASFATPVTTTLTVGTVTDDFIVTTLAEDTVPDAFTFTDQTDVALNTAIDSQPVVVAGINSPSPITIVGGEYSINGGTFTAADGTVNNGDSVVVRVTSSSSFATPVTATLTIGGVSDAFDVTTITQDTTPDAFVLADQTDVALSTPIDSTPIIVTGINSPAPISIVGGEYAINGGAFTASDGTVSNNDTVVVRVTSSASFSTPVTATLTVGGVSDAFDVTTRAEIDTVPDAFTFTDVTDAAVNTVVESNTITVSGINAPAPISITGGEYSINGGAFTSADGTVASGDTVAVRLTSSTDLATAVSATLTIGGVSDAFDVTTTTQPTNGAPVLQSISDQNVKVNNALTFTAKASDPNGDTLIFSLENSPIGASIDSETGVFSWTPTQTGTFTFAVVVSDGTLTDSQTVTVNVSNEEVPVVVAASRSSRDHCGESCRKLKELKRKYKNDEIRMVYFEVKAMKVSNPAEFARLQNIFQTYRKLSDRERNAQLTPKVLAEFKLFKSYNGYKEYRQLKERLD